MLERNSWVSTSFESNNKKIGRYLISVAGCIFDPAQPDQLKINTKEEKKREGKGKRKKRRKRDIIAEDSPFHFTS